MRLDVLPEGRDYYWPCLGVDSEEPGQALVQLELKGLVVQQEKDRALDVLVTGTFHLQ